MKLERTVREWRQAAGLSQVGLAERLGCAQTDVSRMERGKVRLRAETLIEIAKACGVEPVAFGALVAA